MRRLKYIGMAVMLAGANTASAGLSDAWNAVFNPFGLGIESDSPEPGERSVCLAGYRYQLSTLGRLVLTEDQLTELKARGDLVEVEQDVAQGPVKMDSEGFQQALAQREQMIVALTGPQVDDHNVSMLIPEGSLKHAVSKAVGKTKGAVQVEWSAPDYYVEKPFIVMASNMEEFLAGAIQDLPLTLEYGSHNGEYVVAAAGY